MKLNKFAVIGIAVRTTNKDGKSQQDIAELWDRFMGQNLLQQIPDRINDDIYCIYTDYESDFMGEYTTILGCMVKSVDNVPEGFIGKIIPETTYRHYDASGKIPESVGKVWAEIWQSDIKRAYIADFDVYKADCNDPEKMQADVFLSVIV